MSDLVQKFENRSLNADRSVDKGFVNTSTNSSILISESGNVTVAASKNIQYKLNYASGLAREISYESQTVTNRKNIKTDEIIINNHKLNPQVYELTDMKVLFQNEDLAIGNLTINANVLVKAWDSNLEKWVLIRRPMRTPLFMNTLGVATAPEDMNIDDNITEEIKEATNSDS